MHNEQGLTVFSDHVKDALTCTCTYKYKAAVKLLYTHHPHHFCDQGQTHILLDRVELSVVGKQLIYLEWPNHTCRAYLSVLQMRSLPAK